MSALKTIGPTRRSPLGRILFPLSVEEFVRSYFQQRPLKISGSNQKFDFLFHPADLKRNLDRVPEIRAVFRNFHQAKIRPADIKEMVQAGATVCFTGLEDAYRKLADAARQIKSELNYVGQVAFRAYLSAPSKGFDIHYDARVATTLQIAGKKRWWYATQIAVPFPAANSARTPRKGHGGESQPRRDSLRSVLLRPGDLLCLPAGTWHCAQAQTMSLALNLSFDHHGTSVFDSIAAAVRRRLERDPAWRAPLPATIKNLSGDQMPKQVAAILCERIDLLQRELSRMRKSTAALRRAWRISIEE